MADNYKNDGLEDFFHKRLKGFEETPQSDLWSKIAIAIPPKPPIVWWMKPIWWAGGISLLAILLYGIWQYQQISQYEKIIKNQSATIDLLEQFKESTLIDKSKLNAPTSNSTNEEISLIQKSNQFDSGIEIQPKKIKIRANNLPKNVSLDKKEQEGIIIEKKAITQLVEATPFTLKEKAKAREPIVKVDFLHSLSTKMIDIPAQSINKQLIIPVGNKVKFYTALQTGIFSTFYKGSINESLAKVENYNSAGYHLSDAVRTQVDMLAGFQFNKKWSIEMGFGLRNNRITLFDSKSFEYSESLFDEISINGFPQAIFTTSGDSPPVIQYELVNYTEADGADIQNGDLFELDAFFKYDTRYASLPFWLKYRIGKKRFHAFAKMGLSWNILTASRRHLRQSDLSFNRIVLEDAPITNDALSGSFFELGFTAGIEYDLNLQNTLAIESIYYHSLSSVLSSKQNALGLALTMKHQF